MTLALLLLFAAPPPAIEVAVPNPGRTLPMLAPRLEALAKIEPRYGPERARQLAGGFADPFDAASLDRIGIDLDAPVRLVRLRADARPLLIAELDEPKRFDEAAKAPPEGSDVVVEGDHVVIGANRRWQTILRRDGTRLFGLRATRALGLGRADPEKLIARERPILSGAIRDAPRRFTRPRGTPAGRDVYAQVRNVGHVTSLELSAKFPDAKTTEIDARFALDAFGTAELGDLVAQGGAMRFLAPGAPVVEFAANIPRAGFAEIFRAIGIGSDLETFVTGRVEAALEKDGSLVVAIESKDARRAARLCEALGPCPLTKDAASKTLYPRARIAVEGRVVAVTFGGAVRKLREEPEALGDGLVARVHPNHLFSALARRSEGRDGAEIDAAQLAIVRFTYGSVARIAERVVLRLSRSRHGFVASARLFH